MTGARAAVPLLALVLAAAPPATAGSLVENGTFAEGSADAPTGWQTEAWNRDFSRFGREVAPDGTAAAIITNLQPNDARWCQKVAVQPGATYRVAGRVKTRDVGADTAGAFIAIEPRVADTPEVHGTQDWQWIEVIAQAKDETAWEICPRLGSYANLNTGAAWFTDVQMTEVRKAAYTHGWRPWQVWQMWSRTRGVTIALPLFAGVLLALGLGLGRRRH